MGAHELPLSPGGEPEVSDPTLLNEDKDVIDLTGSMDDSEDMDTEDMDGFMNEMMRIKEQLQRLESAVQACQRDEHPLCHKGHQSEKTDQVRTHCPDAKEEPKSQTDTEK